MANETQDKIDEVVEGENTVKAQEQKPTFTQEQQIVVNRIEKRAKDNAESKWKDVLSAKDAQIAELEGILKPTLESLYASSQMSEAVTELLKQLPLSEQLKRLQDPDFVAKSRAKVEIPKTPTANESNTEQSKGLFRRKSTF